MSGVGGKERQLINCEWLDSIVKFKAHFGCHDCLYKDESRICFTNCECRVAGYPETGVAMKSDYGECEGCPYGNGTGTCFGFCIRAILNEYRPRSVRNGGK